MRRVGRAALEYSSCYKIAISTFTAIPTAAFVFEEVTALGFWFFLGLFVFPWALRALHLILLHYWRKFLETALGIEWTETPALTMLESQELEATDKASSYPSFP